VLKTTEKGARSVEKMMLNTAEAATARSLK